MLFSDRLPLTTLLHWSRSLKHGLDIGLSAEKILRQQAKSSSGRAQTVALAMAEKLHTGSSLDDVVQEQRTAFPPLFVELVTIGEKTGRLTEVFIELEDFFTARLSAQKMLRVALIWPAMMYITAVLIVALMLLVLGMIAPSGQSAFDPLGLGLTGPSGAFTFLAIVGTFTAGVILAFLWMQGNEAIRSKAEAKALVVPGLAKCFRSFALYRFAVALHMTTLAGLRANQALQSSLRATSNAAYMRHANEASKRIKKGSEIAPVVERFGETLFPAEFVDSIRVGELTGNLAEVMEKQSHIYREEANRQLKFLTSLFGGGIYLMVGIMFIVVILRIAMSIAGVYDDAMKGL